MICCSECTCREGRQVSLLLWTSLLDRYVAYFIDRPFWNEYLLLQPESHCKLCPSRNHQCLSYEDDIYHPDIFIEMQSLWYFKKDWPQSDQFMKASIRHLTVMDPWEMKAEVEETKRRRRWAKAPWTSLMMARNNPSLFTTDWSLLRGGLAYHLLNGVPVSVRGR